MKPTILILSLTLASPALSAAGVAECRQLLLSQAPSGRAADPSAYFKDAERAYGRCRGAEFPLDVRVGALVKYAEAMYLRRDPQAASGAYREALALLDGAGEFKGVDLVEIIDDATLADTEAQLRADALAHSARALELRRAKFGVDSAEAAVGMVNLANVHSSFAEYAEAEALLRSAIATAEKACGPQCEALTFAYSGMVALYTAQGNAAEVSRFEALALDSVPPRVRTPKR
jgi:hypothetical protein